MIQTRSSNKVGDGLRIALVATSWLTLTLPQTLLAQNHTRRDVSGHEILERDELMDLFCSQKLGIKLDESARWPERAVTDRNFSLGPRIPATLGKHYMERSESSLGDVTWTIYRVEKTQPAQLEIPIPIVELFESEYPRKGAPTKAKFLGSDEFTLDLNAAEWQSPSCTAWKDPVGNVLRLGQSHKLAASPDNWDPAVASSQSANGFDELAVRTLPPTLRKKFGENIPTEISDAQERLFQALEMTRTHGGSVEGSRIMLKHAVEIHGKMEREGLKAEAAEFEAETIDPLKNMVNLATYLSDSGCGRADIADRIQKIGITGGDKELFDKGLRQSAKIFNLDQVKTRTSVEAMLNSPAALEELRAAIIKESREQLISLHYQAYSKYIGHLPADSTQAILKITGRPPSPKDKDLIQTILPSLAVKFSKITPTQRKINFRNLANDAQQGFKEIARLQSVVDVTSKVMKNIDEDPSHILKAMQLNDIQLANGIKELDRKRIYRTLDMSALEGAPGPLQSLTGNDYVVSSWSEVAYDQPSRPRTGAYRSVKVDPHIMLPTVEEGLRQTAHFIPRAMGRAPHSPVFELRPLSAEEAASESSYATRAYLRDQGIRLPNWGEGSQSAKGFDPLAPVIPKGEGKEALRKHYRRLFANLPVGDEVADKVVDVELPNALHRWGWVDEKGNAIARPVSLEPAAQISRVFTDALDRVGVRASNNEIVSAPRWALKENAYAQGRKAGVQSYQRQSNFLSWQPNLYKFLEVGKSDVSTSDAENALNYYLSSTKDALEKINELARGPAREQIKKALLFSPGLLASVITKQPGMAKYAPLFCTLTKEAQKELTDGDESRKTWQLINMSVAGLSILAGIVISATGVGAPVGVAMIAAGVAVGSASAFQNYQGYKDFSTMFEMARTTWSVWGEGLSPDEQKLYKEKSDELLLSAIIDGTLSVIQVGEGLKLARTMSLGTKVAKYGKAAVASKGASVFFAQSKPTNLLLAPAKAHKWYTGEFWKQLVPNTYTKWKTGRVYDFTPWEAIGARPKLPTMILGGMASDKYWSMMHQGYWRDKTREKVHAEIEADAPKLDKLLARDIRYRDINVTWARYDQSARRLEAHARTKMIEDFHQATRTLIEGESIDERRARILKHPMMARVKEFAETGVKHLPGYVLDERGRMLANAGGLGLMKQKEAKDFGKSFIGDGEKAIIDGLIDLHVDKDTRMDLTHYLAVSGAFSKKPEDVLKSLPPQVAELPNAQGMIQVMLEDPYYRTLYQLLQGDGAAKPYKIGIETFIQSIQEDIELMTDLDERRLLGYVKIADSLPDSKKPIIQPGPNPGDPPIVEYTPYFDAHRSATIGEIARAAYKLNTGKNAPMPGAKE